MEPNYSPYQKQNAGLWKRQRKLLLYYHKILSPSNVFYKNSAIKWYFWAADFSESASCLSILVLPTQLPGSALNGNSFQDVSMPLIQFLNVEI